MKYLADDGKVFDTKEGCLAHEAKIERRKHSFLVYDENLNRINQDRFNSYCYMLIRDNPEEVAQYLYEEMGWETGLRGKGIYRLHDEGYWEYLPEIIDDLQTELNTLQLTMIQIEEDAAKVINPED